MGNLQFRRKGGWDNSPQQEEARKQNARKRKWKFLIAGMEMIKGTELDLMKEEKNESDSSM